VALEERRQQADGSEFRRHAESARSDQPNIRVYTPESGACGPQAKAERWPVVASARRLCSRPEQGTYLRHGRRFPAPPSGHQGTRGTSLPFSGGWRASAPANLIIWSRTVSTGPRRRSMTPVARRSAADRRLTQLVSARPARGAPCC
jgi:hypothetical protein